MRLIDADELKIDYGFSWDDITPTHEEMIAVIERQPTIDAVPVVRCKDCKHKVTTEDGEYNPHDIVCDYWESDGLEETDFCSYGEGRDDEV